MNKRTLKLSILAFLFIWIAIVLFTGKAKAQRLETALEYHQKLQKENSWDNWKKNQPKKRLKAAKFAVTASNENSKEARKNAKLNAKIEAIKQRIR